jgi:hypothetical protein
MSSFVYGQSRETVQENLEFKWSQEPSKMTNKSNGSIGWAHIHRRSGGQKESHPLVCRVHICRKDPCEAVWPEAKYGTVGPPIHVTQFFWTEALEADLNGEVHGAGGEPLVLTDLPPLPPPPEPSPVADACLQSGESLGQFVGIDGQCAESQGAEGQLMKQWLKWIDDNDVNGPLEEEVPAAVAAVPEEVLAAVTAVPVQQIEPTSAPLHLLRPGEAIDAASVIPQASCAVSLPMAAPSLPPSHHTNLLNNVLQLARSIRKPRSHVGYVAFVCFALCKRLLVHMWEGAYRVSLIHHYAPWALEDITAATACDGICCCIAPAVPGGDSDTTWYPVSADHPLNEVKHYVAGIPMDKSIPQDTNTLAGFYSATGIALLGTVCDGDCGLDAMCIMASLPQHVDQRTQLRDEIYEYIIQRAEEPQFHDLLVACAELSLDDVHKYRESIASGPTCGGDGIFVAAENTFADAGESDAKPQRTNKNTGSFEMDHRYDRRRHYRRFGLATAACCATRAASIVRNASGRDRSGGLHSK